VSLYSLEEIAKLIRLSDRMRMKDREGRKGKCTTMRDIHRKRQ